MEPSGALLIQQREDRGLRGDNSISRLVQTLNCAIVSDVHSSHMFGPALPDIKCNEEQEDDYCGCTGIDNEGDVIIDLLRVEHAKEKKKKKKWNRRKTQSTKEEVDNPASKSDEFPKQETSLTAEGSPCTFEALCDDSRKDTTCSKEETEGASTNSLTKNSEEGFASRYLSECNSCKTMDIKSFCKGCGRGSTKSGCQCCNVDNVDDMVKSDAVNYGYHHQIWRGEENSPLNWQRSRRNFREGKLHSVSRLDCANVKEHMSLRETNFRAQQNSFAGKVLLPTPMVSSAGHSNAACVSNRMANTERKMHRGFPSKVFSRHDWVPRHRLNRNHSQYFSLSNRALEIECDKSILLSQCPFVFERNRNREIGWGGYGQTFSRPIFTHGSYCLNPSTAASDHVQQRFTRWIPRMNHVTDRYSDTSVDGKLHSRLKYYNEYRGRRVIPSRAKTMWVPVCTKDSVMPQNTYSASVCDSYDIPQFSCNVLTDSLSNGDVVPLGVSNSLSDSKSLSLKSSHRKTSVEGEAPKSEEFSAGQKVVSAKEDMACTEKSRDVAQCLGSQLRTEESNAARKLQLEYYSTLGHPIAEFERFLHSAAPVITSSCIYENQLLNSSLCQTQKPTTSLQAVWQWYEMPGNYGLEIKARDSQNINGLLAESTSFCAYFVPSLSAVQLFGYPHLSYACGENLHTNPELIFEFFESEMPHLRKPLHLKIRDLISIETANLQVFGDPSKLESMNLHDLHPATWFSVAWYPIYRIPAGKFSASFLTYHLLGQSVVQTIPIDSLSKMFQIVFPVIGLLSYNTKDECWFDLRTPVESSSKETTSFSTTEILKERCRTLEGKALQLSRGSVTEDKVNGLYNHPDCMFFASRKC